MWPELSGTGRLERVAGGDRLRVTGGGRRRRIKLAREPYAGQRRAPRQGSRAEEGRSRNLVARDQTAREIDAVGERTGFEPPTDRGAAVQGDDDTQAESHVAS